jgi:hypothetical protein
MTEKIEALEALIGEWTMAPRFERFETIPDVVGHVAFEWMPGRRFVVQRWEVPVPEAPDGVALLGPHEDRDGLVQHYFDSRGVHRVYDMTLEDGVWTLEREHPGFDQRFRGTFSDDGDTIEGVYEMRNDADWFKDFEMTYARVR